MGYKFLAGDSIHFVLFSGPMNAANGAHTRARGPVRVYKSAGQSSRVRYRRFQ